ncbi:MAG TPA: DUF302 domain-containing protein [Chromatiales bacterium]|nr:DUF302 domain-containing protein [Thiotrichales bacterium]HIP67400.1 DUF302 domain-containing protein [Chromatiales bacterium]
MTGQKQSGNAILIFIIALLIGVAGTLYVLRLKAPELLVKEVQSPYGFDETLEKLEANAKELGWKVPKKWKANFQANFNKVVGVDIGPMKLLKMCEPKVAADLLIKDENKYLSVMMPCTFAVYEKADGKTYIAMMNLAVVAQMIGGDVVTAMEVAMPDMEKMVNLK